MDVLRDDYEFATLVANFEEVLQLEVSALEDVLEVVEFARQLDGHVDFPADKLRTLRNAVAQSEDQCRKYYATKENVKHVLAKYGVAIVPQVLDEDECRAILDGMWSFLETITADFEVPIRRADQASWKSFYDLILLHSMLMQHWKVGHAQFVWDVRQNRSVASIFAALWGVQEEELLVSFDGVSFHIPPEVTKRGHYRGNEWFHTDQSLRDSTFQCVQGWVTALKVRPGDATLTFLEGSHKLHGEFARTISNPKAEDWYKLSEAETAWFSGRGCKRRNIVCPPGSLVLWDSRTMHAGKEALKNRERENFRCVVYVCYTPQRLISEADRRKKVRYLEEMRMTSHWPHRIRVFPVTPRTYGDQKIPSVCDIPKPVLNALGRRLAGHK